MVKATDTRQPHYLCVRRRSSFNGTLRWRISEASVDTLRVVVADIVAEEPAQVVLIKYDHMIDNFARLHDPTQRSAVPFCHELLYAVRLGLMPINPIVLETSLEKIESLS